MNVFVSGIGGSGRQSAAKLAAFMADYDLFQIEITRNYTPVEWREDIKRVIFYMVHCFICCLKFFRFLVLSFNIGENTRL